MITGWKKLTMDERSHLRENKILCNYDMERQVAQLQKDLTTGLKKPGCWECYFIAKKLGLM